MWLTDLTQQISEQEMSMAESKDMEEIHKRSDELAGKRQELLNELKKVREEKQ